MVNSRRVGHSYERQLAKEVRELGWTKCVTSRYGSREKDDQGVDLINTDPLNIQAKRYNSAPSYFKWLEAMPKDGNYNVVFHKKPNVGELVIMTKDDFYQILEMLINEGIFKPQ